MNLLNYSLLLYLAALACPLLLLVIVWQLVLIGARLRAMHQEMIDAKEMTGHVNQAES